MVDTSRSTIWVDAYGRTRQTILRGNAGLGGVVGVLVAASNADRQRDWEGPTLVNVSPSPSTALYSNTADYAALVFSSAAGDLVYVTLPAPHSNLFLSDQETIDVSMIGPILAAVIGTVTTAAGAPVVNYVGGYRRRSGKEYQ